jgi:hypothetical protein
VAALSRPSCASASCVQQGQGEKPCWWKEPVEWGPVEWGPVEWGPVHTSQGAPLRGREAGVSEWVELCPSKKYVLAPILMLCV